MILFVPKVVGQNAGAEVVRPGSLLTAQVLRKVDVAKGSPTRIERAPCALAQPHHPESGEERPEAPLTPTEQCVRRLARPIHPEDHRERPQGLHVVKRYSVRSRPLGPIDHLQENGR